MKPCIHCGEAKPLTEFYRHPQMADGYLNACKECHKERMRERYREKRNDPDWLLAERKRTRERFHRLNYGERYGSGCSKAKARWNERNPEKKAAHTAVSNAVRDGRLIKPDHCEECGAGGRIHGHHDDYSKPLEVRWLCPACHGREHWLGLGEQRAA